MAPPVDPPAHLLERIRATFPALPLASVRLDPDGLVNTVVIVNDEWVCRFAKDERCVQALVREAKILDLVRRYFAVVISMYGGRFLQRMARAYPAIVDGLDPARSLAGTAELPWR